MKNVSIYFCVATDIRKPYFVKKMEVKRENGFVDYYKIFTDNWNG